MTGDKLGPIPSQNVYSADSVLIIVQDAPSFIISLLVSFGQGVAYKNKYASYSSCSIYIVSGLSSDLVRCKKISLP